METSLVSLHDHPDSGANTFVDQSLQVYYAHAMMSHLQIETIMSQLGSRPKAGRRAQQK